MGGGVAIGGGTAAGAAGAAGALETILPGTGLFFGLYALFRIFGEQFREPDAAMVGFLTKGQFFSLFMFIFAAGFLAHAWRGWKKSTSPAE